MAGETAARSRMEPSGNEGGALRVSSDPGARPITTALPAKGQRPCLQHGKNWASTRPELRA
jgi:hypothetical protein